MKKVCVLLAEGFEEVEALTICDIIRRTGMVCDLVSMKEKEVKSSHGVIIKSDKIFDKSMEYDLVALPGGMPGAINLRDDNRVIEFINKHHKLGKLIGAICAAPIVLGKAELTTGRKVTSYPGFEEELEGCIYKEDNVVVDGNIITSRGPATTMAFAYTLIEKLGYDKVDDLAKSMLYK
ncbi:DJ-1 family glyoxalase III [Clostridium uliginosum]|uniref:4-methyl-5(B-hydroxyethyl)-thiazole monophosphate biosynthesis n=1 Tax=Clostridium uliginosum TaxID=119641 RepID=A0A1I1RH18_9CLOT|nr:DJ-1 family glyoxalase III [Clostridium uliginosum]SFD33427.1 4-methyl-5(b-hydroxyethyl)-thiazole monophosphate biosynthesis [Clostridium uliginosum]